MPINPGSTEFYIILGLTIFIIIMKLVIAGTLGKKVIERSKKGGKLSIDLVFGIFLFTFLAAISRILFSIFDFWLTKFDENEFVSHVFWWKTAMLLSQVSIALLLYILDRDMFNFKLKGILAYIVLGTILVQFIYPVKEKADFDFVSGLTLIVVCASALLPIMFFIIGKRNPAIRNHAWKIAFGIILYSLAAVILMENIVSGLEIQFGEVARVLMFLLATISKSIGLILIYLGTSTFKS